MKPTKYMLVIVISAMSIMFLASDSMAWWYSTYDIEIESPQEGEKFGTHDLIRVRWTAYFYGQIPPQGIHYMIKLNQVTLTYDYYDNFSGDIPGQNTYFTARGSFDWRVPGNGYSKNPNSILAIWSGSDDCSDCYDRVESVIIGVKTWYDPLPRPQQVPSGAMGENITESHKSNYLNEPYPNPFNPHTTIRFGLKAPSNVSLKIFNVQGQLVKTLRDDTFVQAGEYQESWNGTDNNGNKVPSGVYFLKLRTSKGYSVTRKMALVQ
jgi:hypothetical protein